jgi:hypothetical protein
VATEYDFVYDRIFNNFGSYYLNVSAAFTHGNYMVSQSYCGRIMHGYILTGKSYCSGRWRMDWHFQQLAHGQ